MKLFCSLLSFFTLFFIVGCKTGSLSSQPTTDATISPMTTFAVTPPNGAYNLIGIEPNNVPALTKEALSGQLTNRGYTQVPVDASPDFIVNNQWIISMQNNPEYQVNAGDPTTAQQIPELVQVASLDVYVIDGSSGKTLWRGSSPWPFNAARGTASDIEKAAAWALDRFPYQQAAVKEN